MTFDPNAATAAYMATLTPAQHARAVAYTHGSEWLLLWSWLATVAAAIVILRAGLLARLSDRLGGRNAAVAACIALFTALDWLLELPWSIDRVASAKVGRKSLPGHRLHHSLLRSQGSRLTAMRGDDGGLAATPPSPRNRGLTVIA